MSCIGNIIWMLFGGIASFLSWTIAGIACCITIIGIPIGKQCFKIALFSLAPFGKEIINRGNSVSFLANVIWVLLIGWELCLIHLCSAILLTLTIIGIPFAAQSFKLAMISFAPFGVEIV
ncbi:Uncharacterized membrane protein YccF, DUF307 family [Pilibacter termitis]|uniref:Uncharacterized membrane protein YccF, DUF307 family n=1 Tax=Pilibacter termitis TaxID=263852 RepID=A0A1T4QUX2_9ENTE|nr:YccF domain-containing protein [Pilibacter termitis]SKA07495.1 Uncharacterized membrane protein YccF, DUF307 family [Pilibacter termitis]